MLLLPDFYEYIFSFLQSGRYRNELQLSKVPVYTDYIILNAYHFSISESVNSISNFSLKFKKKKRK